ncbi:MAG: type II toxin-antitoxin system VapC family toxin [Verrucomicrobiota bacterium]|nr:type II toxin-antitoxin system VapC family toxin [Verrucomicrobiota bacterium]
MIFWDTSAIVPLLVKEASSPSRVTLLRQDADGVVWWATEIECLSALCRRQRERKIAPSGFQQGLSILKSIIASMNEVTPSEQIRSLAARLLQTHPLRTADALQLAAAITGSTGDPRQLLFACADERLAEAARREGFTVFPFHQIQKK